MKNFISIALMLAAATLVGQTPIIKITANEVERDYRILFSSQETQNVKIELLSSMNETLMEEIFFEKGFMQTFSLDQVPEGRYRWKVSYGNKSYTEDFEIKSMKKLLKESISVALNDLNLDINVKEFNKEPVNIFLFNSLGEQVDYVFWEPNDYSRSKKIDLSRYEAYEIKLEILQNGDLAYASEFKLY